MRETVTATRAARQFSKLLNRVRYQGESFVITRGGEEVARLAPPAAPEPAVTLRSLLERLRQVPPPDEGFAREVEAIQADQPSLPSDPWRS